MANFLYSFYYTNKSIYTFLKIKKMPDFVSVVDAIWYQQLTSTFPNLFSFCQNSCILCWLLFSLLRTSTLVLFRSDHLPLLFSLWSSHVSRTLWTFYCIHYNNTGLIVLRTPTAYTPTHQKTSYIRVCITIQCISHYIFTSLHSVSYVNFSV